MPTEASIGGVYVMSEKKYELTDGDRVIDAVCKAAAIKEAIETNDGCIVFVWAANAPE